MHRRFWLVAAAMVPLPEFTVPRSASPCSCLGQTSPVGRASPNAGDLRLPSMARRRGPRRPGDHPAPRTPLPHACCRALPSCGFALACRTPYRERRRVQATRHRADPAAGLVNQSQPSPVSSRHGRHVNATQAPRQQRLRQRGQSRSALAFLQFNPCVF